MKKFKVFSTVLTVVLMLSSISTGVFAAQPQSGDVNNDGKVTVVDAKWILQSVANLKSFGDEEKSYADVNKDEKITVLDAKWILQSIAGLRELGNSPEMYPEFEGVPNLGSFAQLEEKSCTHYNEDYEPTTNDDYCSVEYVYNMPDTGFKDLLKNYYKLLTDNDFIICYDDTYEDDLYCLMYNQESTITAFVCTDSYEKTISISIEKRYMCSYDDFSAPDIGKAFGINYTSWSAGDYSAFYEYNYAELKSKKITIEKITEFMGSNDFRFHESHTCDDENGISGDILYRNEKTNAVVLINYNDENNCFSVEVFYTITYDEVGITAFEDVTGISCGYVSYQVMDITYGYNTEKLSTKQLNKYIDTIKSEGFVYVESYEYESNNGTVRYDYYQNSELCLNLMIVNDASVDMIYIELSVIM